MAIFFNVFGLGPTERRLWVFRVLNFLGEQQLKMSGPADLRVRVPGMGGCQHKYPAIREVNS